MHNPFQFNIVSTQKLTSKEIKEKKNHTIKCFNIFVFAYFNHVWHRHSKTSNEYEFLSKYAMMIQNNGHKFNSHQSIESNSQRYEYLVNFLSQLFN